MYFLRQLRCAAPLPVPCTAAPTPPDAYASSSRGGGSAADPSIRALSCHLGGHVIRRHDSLTNEILQISGEAGCHPSGRHPTFRDLGVPTGGVRDDDAVDGVFWRGPSGQPVVFDVRVKRLGS